MRTLPAILVALLIVGCARTETYQVRLTNKTAGPITFGLVKQGDPYEPKWAAPEDAAMNGSRAVAENWGSVGAGKTAVSQPIKGRFRNNAAAYLRVYEGKLDLAGIMAVSRGAPNRADILLTPGANQVTVTEDKGQLVAQRNGIFDPR